MMKKWLKLQENTLILSQNAFINKDFEIKTKPDKTKVCKECDFKHFCRVII